MRENGNSAHSHSSDLSPHQWESEIGVCNEEASHKIPVQMNSHTDLHLTGRHRAATLLEPDNNSFFSTNNFSKVINSTFNSGVTEWPANGLNHMPDVLPPVHSSEDWQAAFGFPPGQEEHTELCVRDDDLGFDPFHETQKAFAEMMEKEDPNRQHNFQPKLLAMQHNHHRISTCTKLVDGLRIGSSISPRTRLPPPGFTSIPNHMNAFGLGIPRTGSKNVPFMQPTITFPQHTQTQAWDWTALDPAIVAAQHCELFTTPPPPGFPLRQTLDNL